MTHPPIDRQITFLYTRDLAKTAHFYEEILELPLKLDQGSCRIYQVSRDGYVGFCQRDRPVEGAEAPVIITLVTPNVDAWYEQLAAQGIEFEKAPAVNPRYNIHHCFLRDPNGYLIEIQRFLHPF
jgi:catechol 2,3-dioxygenase-like lactoylglutathione lyase family enzyme